MDPTAETPEELSLKRAVNTVMNDLPAPVQRFLKSPARDEVVASLSKKYALHVDQAGTFELAFLHMLLGVASPETFVATLRAAGIPSEVVSSLASEVNEQVFKRLREEEQGADPERSREPFVQSVPVVPSPASTPLARPMTPPVQSMPAALPPVSIPPILPPAPTTIFPMPIPPPSVPGSVADLSPFPVSSSVRTMATDMQEARVHSSEPQLRAESRPHHPPAIPPPINIPRPPAVTPHVSEPPPNLPGQTPVPLVREYGVDPYRESVE